jgi:hypothetical protein
MELPGTGVYVTNPTFPSFRAFVGQMVVGQTVFEKRYSEWAMVYEEQGRKWP